MRKQLAAYKLGFYSDHFIAVAQNYFGRCIDSCNQYAEAAKLMLESLAEMEDAFTSIAVDVEPSVAPMVFEILKTLAGYVDRLAKTTQEQVELEGILIVRRIPFVKTWHRLLVLIDDALKCTPRLSCWARFGSLLSSSSRRTDGTLSDEDLRNFDDFIVALSLLPESLVRRIKVLECLFKESEKTKRSNPVVLVHKALEDCRQARGGTITASYPELLRDGIVKPLKVQPKQRSAHPIRLDPNEVKAPTAFALFSRLQEVNVCVQWALEFLPEGHDLTLRDIVSGEPCAILDGIVYAITREQQLILKVLLDARGVYVTAQEIQRNGGALLRGKRVGNHVRELPRAFTDLIETAQKKGGGFRLVLN